MFLNNFFYIIFFLLFLPVIGEAKPKVQVGSEVLFSTPYAEILTGKKIGLVTNHTAVSSSMQLTLELLHKHSKQYKYSVTALFAPEHGIQGFAYAGETIEDQSSLNGLPIYSLHGKTRRPTELMLHDIDLLIYDIQDIGSRSYTYITTLFYVIEAAAKANIPVLVLDRPNPINGITIDGPMLNEDLRSFVGYVNVPYCHGMTVGELAQFFNKEYKIGCNVQVIPMKGWKRSMSFKDTGLHWIPTSPNIPESSTAYFYPTTGFLGELGIVNIGIGYTLPFKVVGAPWINAKKFAQALNSQKPSGVHFEPFYYRPFYGKFAGQDCQGIFIVITDPKIYKPVTTQYLIIGILKSLYSNEFKQALTLAKGSFEIFNKVNGTPEVLQIIQEQPYIAWPLKLLHQKQRDNFKQLRLQYLIPDYKDL
jgi:uncharacterized protein YbbC (DUF1343 family)